MNVLRRAILTACRSGSAGEAADESSQSFPRWQEAIPQERKQYRVFLEILRVKISRRTNTQALTHIYMYLQVFSHTSHVLSCKYVVGLINLI